MARNYILGGQAGTQLQAGKPYFKRIVRINGAGDVDRNVAATTHPGSVGYTVDISANGEISFDAKSKDWNAGNTGVGGELLMIEFPTTMRSVEINLEESWVGSGANEAATAAKQDAGDGVIRCKVMLTAENGNGGQKTHFFNADGTEDTDTPIATPISNNNFIELRQGETATISSRTKVVFVLIQKYGGDDILAPASGLAAPADGHALDAVSILVTGVLDHEPTSGGSQAALEPNSKIIEDGGAETRTLRKIWGAADGIG
tara:strand:+ start:3419 stop:4198 length:780 start_codon:yes stop_codon:yes gene_type:complete